MDIANAAKTLKEMHERNEIAGRPAGTFLHGPTIPGFEVAGSTSGKRLTRATSRKANGLPRSSRSQ